MKRIHDSSNSGTATRKSASTTPRRAHAQGTAAVPFPSYYYPPRIDMPLYCPPSSCMMVPGTSWSYPSSMMDPTIMMDDWLAQQNTMLGLTPPRFDAPLVGTPGATTATPNHFTRQPVHQISPTDDEKDRQVMKAFERMQQEVAQERMEYRASQQQNKQVNDDTPDVDKEWWGRNQTDLNWSHCDHGATAHPVVSEACTLLGPFDLDDAPESVQQETLTQPKDAFMFKRTADILRNAGYRIQIIPDGYTPDEEDTDATTPNAKRRRIDDNLKRTAQSKQDQREMEYLLHDMFYEGFDFFEVANQQGKVVAKFTNAANDDHPWLVVHCTTAQVTDSIRTILAQEMLPIAVWHKEEHIAVRSTCTPKRNEKKPMDQKYAITCTTGIGPEVVGGDTMQSILPTSLFVMRRKCDDKVVAKALLSYSTGLNVGPTLELMEVAKPLRGLGLGVVLLVSLRNYFDDMFADLYACDVETMLYVARVSNEKALQWYIDKLGFEPVEGNIFMMPSVDLEFPLGDLFPCEDASVYC